MSEEAALQFLRASEHEFCESRLILVERVISGFLQGLTENPDLLAILEDCAKSASYPSEYKKAVSRDGVGSYLLLPQGTKQMISLVTGLMYEFDNGTISIVDFVTKFFPSDSSNASYGMFCERIIKPYFDAFTRRLKGEPDTVSETLAEKLQTPYSFPDKAKEDCEHWLKALLDIAAGDNNTPEDKRREYIEMIKGMIYVLEGRNPLLIKLLWTGLKNTLGNFRPGRRELSEIKNILTVYGVL
jgi:hypothetical protein